MRIFQNKKDPTRTNKPVEAEGQEERAAYPNVELEGEEQTAEETDVAAEQPPEFFLSYEPDGVYMTLSNPLPLTLREQERLIRHFSRKKIRNLDMEVALPAINAHKAEHLCIAPPQDEVCYDETYTVAISPNMMEASITLAPPEPGCGKRLEAERLLSDLPELHQIAYGVDEAAFRAFLESPIYDEAQAIAHGTPPVTGEDGKLEWQIDRREGSGVYRIRQVDDEQKADYKNLELFVQVKADQLLVTRTPPKEGTPGHTVLGREVPAESGKNYLLPRGKNTYISSDGMELRASMAGRVDEINGCLEVSSLYHVLGDVDLSVGNIDFDGDVAIDGNVLSGFTIKATGCIEVKGIVEASALEAGGDILIMGGVQGGGKGMLQAKDGICVRFAEYATLQAGSIISAQSLLHSNVNCMGSVEVTDGRGSIIGGNVCAGTYIAARYLGNPSGRGTELQVGLSPHNRLRLTEMEKTVAALKKEVDRLQNLLQDTPDTRSKNQREQDNRMENVRKLLQYKKMMLDEENELQELKENLGEKKNGEVHAMHTAYPGVSISIGLARMVMSQPITYATFRNVNEQVEFTSCRFRPRMTSGKKRRR